VLVGATDGAALTAAYTEGSWLNVGLGLSVGDALGATLGTFEGMSLTVGDTLEKWLGVLVGEGISTTSTDSKNAPTSAS
jgi:hypothetical protein